MHMIKGLIATRFLILIAHLIMAITMFWSLDLNATSCIGSDTSKFDSARQFLLNLLSITMALFAIELGSFLFGLSMFNTSQSLLSIATHTSGCATLSFFILDKWACYTFWYIFWFCSVLPTITEIVLILFVGCS